MELHRKVVARMHLFKLHQCLQRSGFCMLVVLHSYQDQSCFVTLANIGSCQWEIRLGAVSCLFQLIVLFNVCFFQFSFTFVDVHIVTLYSCLSTAAQYVALQCSDMRCHLLHFGKIKRVLVFPHCINITPTQQCECGTQNTIVGLTSIYPVQKFVSHCTQCEQALSGICLQTN